MNDGLAAEVDAARLTLSRMSLIGPEWLGFVAQARYLDSEGLQ